ncbi:MAG TPA: sugar kinase [Novosphingobium sp.]
MTGPIICFGEMLLRFATAPGHRIAEARTLDLVVGGAEANVAVALAALGHRARMVTLLPDNPLGDRALAALAANRVETGAVLRGPGRMGIYFLEQGASLRASAITYDRAGSAFALAGPEAFDFPALLAGARLLHLSGITAALGPGGLALARAAIAAAHDAGVPVSFDPNYRESLWSAWDSRPREALHELIAGADILFAGHRDMALVLGRTFAGEGAERRAEAAAAAFAAFPRLQVMASTARHPLTQTHHRIAARVDRRDQSWQTGELDVTDIVDRIGTGDAFAAGVIDAWLNGADARAMAESGLALGALKHGLHGDFCPIARAELTAFSGTTGDVRR